jgi:hypothetical protein
MAHALMLPGSNTVLEKHPSLTWKNGFYTYTVETRNNASTYSVTDGSQTISVPVRWSFGADSQTWVLEYKGQFYESLVSFYPRMNRLDITIGDQTIRPSTLEEAFGRQLHPGEYTACFGCHTTGAVTHDTLHLESLKPGVTCEHCHTGVAQHLEAISQGKLDSLPPKLKGLGAEQIANFCGQCHRSWETVVRDRLYGQINVRFQPYRLTNSKCFNGADTRISCIACHNPHQEVVRNVDFYDAKCLACHSSGASSETASLRKVSLQTAAAAGRARPCAVAKSRCVICHMPKVDLPGGHRPFTDHYIRIVHQGEPYPN